MIGKGFPGPLGSNVVLAVLDNMQPHPLTPDWAISCMKRITKYDDPDLLEAALELLAGVSDMHGEKGDCAQAAMDYGYRQTVDCEKHCVEYLGIAV